MGVHQKNIFRATYKKMMKKLEETEVDSSEEEDDFTTFAHEIEDSLNSKPANLDKKDLIKKLVYAQQLDLMNKELENFLGKTPLSHWQLRKILKHQVKNGIDMLKVKNRQGKTLWTT